MSAYGPDKDLSLCHRVVMLNTDFWQQGWLIVGGLVVVLLGAGMWLVRHAWRQATPNELAKSHNSILASLGSGLITGGVLALAGLVLQFQYANITQEATWRNSVETSAAIAGLDATGHDLHKPHPLRFSGKILPEANFENVDASGLSFRGADVSTGHFNHAILRGAVFFSTDLHSAEFVGADLTTADLRVANLSQANIEKASSMKGAMVNSLTCWPEHFLESGGKVAALRASLRPADSDPRAKNALGREWPGCVGGTTGISKKPTVAPCTTEQLSVELTTGDTDSAESSADIRLTNVTGDTCSVRGFGTLTLILADGGQVPMSITPQGANNRTVELTARAAVRSTIRWDSRSCLAEGTTPVGTALQIIPPEATTSRSVPWRGGVVCDGALTQTAYAKA